ncbi:16S rRNA (guanine(527)-N(7))-methyltransferase RsmG [Candidatus Margulisiibacteriota bacterium]
MSSKYKQLLIDTLKAWGIDHQDDQIEQLYIYLRMLQEESKKINLTKITEEQDIVEKHFLDSLAFVKIIALIGSEKIVDVGSGAGLPGLPIALLYPKISMTLVDSTVKKVDFLNKVIKTLHIKNAICIVDRAENLAKDTNHRGKYDIALARAVSKVNILLELMLPFLKIQGKVVLYKGAAVGQELEQAKNSLKILGGELAKMEKFSIGENKRSLILIKKVNDTPQKYPRRAGLPQKKPL